MSDLVRVLRGQRIDGWGADEIMRLAAVTAACFYLRATSAEEPKS